MLYLVVLIAMIANINAKSSHKHSLRLKHRLKMKCKQYWPSDLQELVINHSSEPTCEDTFCRNWNQIKAIAACKVKKVKEILEDGQQLYYLQTVYKAEGQEEWAKFIYTIVEGSNMENMDLKVKKGAFLLRVCVSVDKKYNAWADDKCPLDECEPYQQYLKKKECKHTDQTKHEMEVEMKEDYQKFHERYNQ